MKTTTIKIGTLAITLPDSVSEDMKREHGIAKSAAASMAEATRNVVDAEGRMSATLGSLYRIARGDMKDAVSVKDIVLVSEWFGIADMTKETASEWISAAIAVAEWHAPDAIVAKGRKALVEWARCAAAGTKAKAEALQAQGLPESMSRIVARGEVRGALLSVSPVDSGNGETSAAGTVLKALPGIEALEKRVAKAEGRRAKRAESAPVSPDAVPSPKGRAEHVETFAMSALAIRDIDMNEGRGRAEWHVACLALLAVLGHAESEALAKALARAAKDAKDAKAAS